jgi:hypothetical protein
LPIPHDDCSAPVTDIPMIPIPISTKYLHMTSSEVRHLMPADHQYLDISPRDLACSD